MVSVPEAAERLRVSPARVRQRIDDGSLVAQKIGGRWIVDLSPHSPPAAGAGRPVNPASVWWSLAAIDIAERDANWRESMARPERLLDRLRAAQGPSPGKDEGRLLVEIENLSRASRHRAAHRIAAAAEQRDHEAMLRWLHHRAERRQYVAADQDLEPLRSDDRFVISGVSHPASGLDDARVAEGYVAAKDVRALEAAYWLEAPNVNEKPNVVLHVLPARPADIGSAVLAADLAEHGGAREIARAHELLDSWLEGLERSAGGPE